MCYDYKVCEKCSRREENKPKCPYRNMSLLQYCDHKNIPYTFKNAGEELWLSVGHIGNSSAIIELKNEINRTNNILVESTYDWLVVK